MRQDAFTITTTITAEDAQCHKLSASICPPDCFPPPPLSPLPPSPHPPSPSLCYLYFIYFLYVWHIRGCLGCCLIPFCNKRLRIAEHKCPQCKTTLGRSNQTWHLKR